MGWGIILHRPGICVNSQPKDMRDSSLTVARRDFISWNDSGDILQLPYTTVATIIVINVEFHKVYSIHINSKV